MDTEIKFIASTVSCYTENDVLIVGIGDNPVTPDNYIIISRLDDDCVDIDDSIGIQTHLTEMEFSNAIESVRLSKNIFTVNIRHNKKNEVCAQKITAELRSENIDFHLLEKYLNNIFTGSSVKIII